jgi:metal-dependent hydrolase (beta-lactamase superfamily II)
VGLCCAGGADDRRILFDTGGRPDTIVINARELGIDLTGIPDGILSHTHGGPHHRPPHACQQLRGANTLEYARTAVCKADVYALIGGWHLFQLNDERLDWTAGKMREYGVQYFLGAHCTGVEAVYRIRELNRMRRDRCVVGAVGATFDLERGISQG